MLEQTKGDRMSRMIWTLICFFLLGTALPIYADEQGANDQASSKDTPASAMPAQPSVKPHLVLTQGLGMMTGDTRYQIGGLLTRPDGTQLQQPDPTSELVFPLDVPMISLKVNLILWERFQIGAGLKKNLSQAAGTMEDSDWGSWYMEPPRYQDGTLIPNLYPFRDDTLDIYSESDAELDALIWDIKVGYRFVNKPRWSLTGSVGFIRQHFKYDVSDLIQGYPSFSDYFGFDPGQDTINGKILTYDISYNIHYCMGELEGKLTNRIKVSGTFGFSPGFSSFPLHVWATDRDHHLYGKTGQGSVSKTDSTGDALMYGLHGGIDLSWWHRESMRLVLSADYENMSIKTSGDSDTTIGGYNGTYSIPEDVKSRQKYFDLNLSFSF